MLGPDPSLVTIGEHVTVSADVMFVTHDGGVWVLRDEVGPVDVFGSITIGDNTFVGARSVLLPGVTIGSSVVIGAGSIVTRSVPDGVVVAGSPARVLSTIEEYRVRMTPFFHYTADMSREEKDRHVAGMPTHTVYKRETLGGLRAEAPQLGEGRPA